MNRDETVALFLQGREAWNVWAETMLAERKALEDAGTWKSGPNLLHPDMERGKNLQTQAWLDKALADFSHCLFLTREAVGSEQTAGEKWRSGEVAVPHKSIHLEADHVAFTGFIFPSNAIFEGATFTGITYFLSATFTGTAIFVLATFAGDAHFPSATFSSGADFGRATFTGGADFRSAAFASDANFLNTTFTGHADFVGAVFNSDALFVSATFLSSTYYSRTKFQKAARFKGIEVKRAFVMTGAEFAQVPAFNQADFKQAPDLDDVKFLLPRFWRKGKAELVAQYRAIRRMAIQGADYEREQMAYKGELRSRRWTRDKFWHAGLWLGLFYDGIADCGRSIVRPANVWLASIVAFAAFYWWRAAAGIETRCAEAGGPIVQALYLSVKNALVIFGGTRDARVNQAYHCLYNNTELEPRIPATVTFVETLAQIPVSATLIFLFLLAVKNRFKIK